MSVSDDTNFYRCYYATSAYLRARCERCKSYKSKYINYYSPTTHLAAIFICGSCYVREKHLDTKIEVIKHSRYEVIIQPLSNHEIDIVIEISLFILNRL